MSTAVRSVLAGLVVALKDASEKLSACSLDEVLHDTEKLPDKLSSELASDALNLLGELRLRLEPRQLILADHFMGETT